MGDKWAENWAWEPKLPECSERDGRGQLEEGSLGVEDLGGSWRILEDLLEDLGGSLVLGVGEEEG